jgi:rhamnose utilization protein RhaD (predicted bifunctional aldolase and dehydrogenase)/NAD(P)-dependent dehydrogenase (short-subunit alcohol dehydrogenase family)
MRPELEELLRISDLYGRQKEYVIAGGGNTSYKNETTIWIKASGSPLAGLTEDGLVEMNREKLKIVASREYSEEPVLREEQVKNDLYAAIVDPSKGKRPSVETSLHELIGYRYVVHLHPTLVNGLLCSRNAKTLTQKLFGDAVLFVPYTDPGYILFSKLRAEVNTYREKNGSDPKVIFLENHGVFVSADTGEEIEATYSEIFSKVASVIEQGPESSDIPYNDTLNSVLPAIRIMLSEDNPKVLRFRNNTLIEAYSNSQAAFQKISHPLTPDIIVYCKYRYIYIDQSQSAERILESFRGQLERFRKEYGFSPKVAVIRGHGIIAADDTVSAADTVLDVFEDLIKICHYSSFCGGTKLLTPDQVSFIDKWEVENYRRKVAKAVTGDESLRNRIAVITGGAQGFGAGIAEDLFSRGVNVIIADINETAGRQFAGTLNKAAAGNRAIFSLCDVSDPDSVKATASMAVREFGGLDIMISNAGILKAGSLEETDPATFRKSTDVNYTGFFYCAKYASEIMKIQNREKPGYFTDIIQINSKSGLRGSNRNFSYAGAKFGGLGLTQSFALELAPDRIKVNAVCPGNFYEGPLWSDPATGLFVQYLKTGKVPGAKTIDDVRRFYEDQVPLKRGCRIGDVMKAILYIIGQEYETGQAVPVTGGQVMLS